MSEPTEPVLGSDLPRLGWHGYEPLSPTKLEPIGPVPGRDVDRGFTKPTGGLWTTPIVEAGGLACTVWVAGHASKYRAPGGSLTEVRPRLRDRFYVIDGRDDLRAAIDRFPDSRNSLDRREQRFGGDFASEVIDYEATAREFAGLVLTTGGVSECNRHTGMRDQAHLWGWDVPTVLFFGPRFTVGEVYEMSPEVVRAWQGARDSFELAEAVRIRQAVIDAAAEQGHTFPDLLLSMPPMGFLMVVSQAMRDVAEE